MTRPRSTLVSLAETPWYHVVSRCVRRALLCGQDAHSGQSFEHRRTWIVERIKQLAGVFAVDVAAYAVMSNHYHLVLRIDAERAQRWSQNEVLRRWAALRWAGAGAARAGRQGRRAGCRQPAGRR